jgi:hypothetical protein
MFSNSNSLYPLSNGIFFTFKISPKAQLFYAAHTTVTSLNSSFTMMINITDFLFHHQKYIRVFMSDTVTDVPMNIAQTTHVLTKMADEIKNLTNILDLQFTS